jgi:hypothetical protein
MGIRRSHNSPTIFGRLRGLPARVLAWLTIAALLGAMVMPLTGAFAAPADGVTLVTVCTDHGIRQVALDDEGQSIPLEKAHHHHRACPFCLSHAGSVILPAGVAVSAPSAVAIDRTRVYTPAGIVPEPVFLSGRPTRAPPAPVA